MLDFFFSLVIGCIVLAMHAIPAVVFAALCYFILMGAMTWYCHIKGRKEMKPTVTNDSIAGVISFGVAVILLFVGLYQFIARPYDDGVMSGMKGDFVEPFIGYNPHDKALREDLGIKGRTIISEQVTIEELSGIAATYVTVKRPNGSTLTTKLSGVCTHLTLASIGSVIKDFRLEVNRLTNTVVGAEDADRDLCIHK